jgi:dihydroxy-acid dehydratase
MYTANTMACAIEALGMSLPYSSSTPAVDPLKVLECRLAGRYVLDLLKSDLKPKDIMTRAAFENAMVVVIALGGSTNAVLHLIAMAHACDIELTLEDFQAVSNRTPFIADLKPSGKYVMEDVHKVICAGIDSLLVVPSWVLVVVFGFMNYECHMCCGTLRG